MVPHWTMLVLQRPKIAFSMNVSGTMQVCICSDILFCYSKLLMLYFSTIENISSVTGIQLSLYSIAKIFCIKHFFQFHHSHLNQYSLVFENFQKLIFLFE